MSKIVAYECGNHFCSYSWLSKPRVSYEAVAALLKRINMLACYASEENTEAQSAALLEIGKLARGEIQP